jgi:hypothetical protein
VTRLAAGAVLVGAIVLAIAGTSAAGKPPNGGAGL